jgi:hypothetical protein
MHRTSILAINNQMYFETDKENFLKDIYISKQSPILSSNHIGKSLVALILAIVIALGILAIQMLPLDHGNQSSVSVQEDRLASGVAVSALEAFFHIDVKEGKEGWLGRFCLLSTESGCQLISTGADAMWVNFQEEKINISAIVLPEEKVAESEREQIWKMNITLSAPLPGSNKLQDSAYVAVVKIDDIWKFDRFLLKPEIDAILSYRTVADSLATEQVWN